MPSDSQIAVLVEVAQSGGIALNEGQKAELAHIIDAGFAERVPGEIVKYKLTDKGHETLDSRGVGANES